MARARGANAQLALAYAASYGAVPASGFVKLPFVTVDLGDEQGLVESDLLGYGRDPQAPAPDVVNNRGNVVVPVDLRGFGYWLKELLGAPSTAQGVAATGTLTFSAQPANNAIITIGGQAFTFVTGVPTANQIKIGANLAETLANAVQVLNASAVAGVLVATYSLNAAQTVLQVTHDTLGTSGNSFTIVAGSSPASNAVASGATLAGGATSGPYNHTFVAGGLTLPDAAVEIGMPDVPSYAMNYGVMADTLSIPMQRSGNLNATIGLIAQGESARTTSTAAGSPTEVVVERFSQFSGQVTRLGAPLGDLVIATLDYANGLDVVEVIRQDGRIAGADAGMIRATIALTLRFKDTVLMDLATNGTPVELVLDWRIAAGKTLRIVLHQVYLPKAKAPITGPGGVQIQITGQAAEHPTLGRTFTAVLTNDVSAY